MPYGWHGRHGIRLQVPQALDYPQLHRRLGCRPGTAMSTTFLDLEDETGVLNVVCSVGVMTVHRQAARNRVAVVVRGLLERSEGATKLIADRVESLDSVVPGAAAVLQARQSCRDWR